ncbi:MAG TPA: phosphohistidine phosphatase SixA [Polyangiaceae bacterium]|nr:phosphohistidine phosphatase SixA [Polyangiaceae bacterium]
MKIYIMRHGPAEDQASTGRDFDRRLTSSGRSRTELAAHELGRWEPPKRIVSSPLVRTIETAEVVMAALGLTFDLERREELAPGGDALPLLSELARQDAKRVMVIGHEPDVSTLTALLLPSWSYSFDKSMIVGLKIDRDALANRTKETPSAKLRFVIDAKRLHN